MNDRMTDGRRGKRSRSVGLWVAAGLFVVSMPCVLGGVLGLLGVLADVGPEENRRIGVQALRLGGAVIGVSAAVLVGTLVAGRSRGKSRARSGGEG